MIFLYLYYFENTKNMPSHFKAIIKSDELSKIIKKDKVKIFDARTGPEAYNNYLKNHIATASFIDLDNDLANIQDFKNGGRHPLPDLNNFLNTIENLGIEKEDHIIIYDDKNGANASARFWWMLKSIGHEKVQILDGGLQKAIENNIAESSGRETYKPSIYPKIEDWQWPTVELKEVEAASKNPEKVIIDVREDFRYNGISEPIDLVAGHIPNAINIPYLQNYKSNGELLTKNELKEKYKDIYNQYESDNIIVHCGSGVTACQTILSIYEGGFDIPKLYVGSWSEWSRNHH